jgi:hypothetical protein
MRVGYAIYTAKAGNNGRGAAEAIVAGRGCINRITDEVLLETMNLTGLYPLLIADC